MAKVAPEPAEVGSTTRPTTFIERNVAAKKPRSATIHFGGRTVNGEARAARSTWYDGEMVVTMRHFMKGKSFSWVVFGGLVIALFLPDVLTLNQVPTNVGQDIILTLVMIVFIFEFITLSLTDANYLFGFFFWMDLLGTVSVFTDVSYLLGDDATKPDYLDGAEAPGDVIVVRAARAAKLGARAGRLSRVLKFVNVFSGNSKEWTQKVQMARVISHQLTNVLSTRVAFLTIMIVVCLPVLGLFNWPTNDFSMASWAEILNSNAEQYSLVRAQDIVNSTGLAELDDFMQSEAGRFSRYFADKDYGPFHLCYGGETHGSFVCQNDILAIDLPASFKMPRRKSSIREIQLAKVQVSFDMSKVKQIEAILNISLMIFVILMMCCFGMAMSASISVIALQPLERMLTVVRDTCSQIFKYTVSMEEEDCENESEADLEEDGEFALLEKAVGKLATIVKLASPEKNQERTEENEIAQNWIGSQVVSQPDHRHTVTTDTDPTTNEEAMKSLMKSLPDDLIEAMGTDSFDSTTLPKELSTPVVMYLMCSMRGSAAFMGSHVHEPHLLKFIDVCEKNYPPNPFHNFSHGVDCMYQLGRYMSLVEADRFMDDQTQFWMMLASLGHDLGHVGLNNPYLIETSHDLALKYNDRSPLENMHCSTLFKISSDPETNVFSKVSKDIYKEMRKGIIGAILHTDMVKHNEMIKELILIYELNLIGSEGSIIEVIAETAVNLTTVSNALLHTADVNNPMKPWAVASRLAMFCVEEFFAQGDLEKAAGIPVQMLNDRTKVSIPNSQIGFIEFVLAPLAESVVNLFPQLDGLADHLATNVGRWSDALIEESALSPEEKAKVQARVQKVRTRCWAVMQEPRNWTSARQS
eukprot:TRINITY_DN28153_c0_g1_i1.p1 TRINITY_DN28153_c0_g1~~TRINITY_DN28153_c0_g1_i1.p1  ORF type:complete len:867 (-),score=158.63 TRINITY_DN28153_c0_g1_i1:97-2697(-)